MCSSTSSRASRCLSTAPSWSRSTSTTRSPTRSAVRGSTARSAAHRCPHSSSGSTRISAQIAPRSCRDRAEIAAQARRRDRPTRHGPKALASRQVRVSVRVTRVRLAVKHVGIVGEGRLPHARASPARALRAKSCLADPAPAQRGARPPCDCSADAGAPDASVVTDGAPALVGADHFVQSCEARGPQLHVRRLRPMA